MRLWVLVSLNRTQVDVATGDDDVEKCRDDVCVGHCVLMMYDRKDR